MLLNRHLHDSEERHLDKLNTFALEFVRFQSEFTDIQKREEELLGKLLQHATPHDGALSLHNVEQQPSTSLSSGGSLVMPFASWHLEQLLGNASGSMLDADSEHDHGLRNDDGHEAPKIEPVTRSVLSEIQATISPSTAGTEAR